MTDSYIMVMLSRGRRHPMMLVRTIALLAAAACIGTLLLLVLEEEPTPWPASGSGSFLRVSEKYDTRQLLVDPKTVKQRETAFIVTSDADATQGQHSDNGNDVNILPHNAILPLDAAADPPNDNDEGGDNLILCNRRTNVPSTEDASILQKYTQCPTITNSKPIIMLQGSKGFGRTGNRIIEFLHAIQWSHERDVQVGIMHNSWAMREVTKMWMSYQGGGREDFEEWMKKFEEAFCVKVFDDVKAFRRGGWNVNQKKPRDLFRFFSRKGLSEYIPSQEYIIRTLFRNINTGEGTSSDGKRVQNMCSGIESLFDDPINTVYSVIHSRSFAHEGGGEQTAGQVLLKGISNHSGCDPLGALEMRFDYIKSILQPLGMLGHPIVFISDGQDPKVLERLLADAEIGPMIRIPPPEAVWIGGDITLGVLSDVYIGNPASTFSTFIAKARMSLGFLGKSYLFRKKDEDGNWKTVCEDECVFNHSVMGVSA